MANGQLERAFTLKFIKTDCWNCLKEHTLDRLILINVEATTQSNWNPETVVKLWSNNNTRRVTQTGKTKLQHKNYPKHCSSSDE